MILPRSRSRQLRQSNIVDVQLSSHGPLLLGPDRRLSAGQRAGLRFERKALEHLSDCYLDQFIPSPWLKYRERGAPYYRFAQPDGFILDVESGRISIIEIKLRHTIQAWQQLRRLYEPLLRHLFREGEWTFSCCEVVGSYDGRVAFPEQFILTKDPLSLPSDSFGLMTL